MPPRYTPLLPIFAIPARGLVRITPRIVIRTKTFKVVTSKVLSRRSSTNQFTNESAILQSDSKFPPTYHDRQQTPPEHPTPGATVMLCELTADVKLQP